MLTEETAHRYLTPAQRRALKQSASECEVCRRQFDGAKIHSVIDHDHSTDKVRGVICRACNIALGYVESARAEPTQAQRTYLERSGSFVPSRVTKPRKEKQETVVAYVRMSPAIRDHLKAQAKREKRSLTGQIDYILRQYAEKEGWVL